MLMLLCDLFLSVITKRKLSYALASDSMQTEHDSDRVRLAFKPAFHWLSLFLFVAFCACFLCLTYFSASAKVPH